MLGQLAQMAGPLTSGSGPQMLPQMLQHARPFMGRKMGLLSMLGSKAIGDAIPIFGGKGGLQSFLGLLPQLMGR